MAGQPRFSLQIDLGNAAMQNGNDVADALTEVFHKVKGLDLEKARGPASGRIYDRNGNNVGYWKLG